LTLIDYTISNTKTTIFISLTSVSGHRLIFP